MRKPAPTHPDGSPKSPTLFSRVTSKKGMIACALILLQSLLYGIGDPISKDAYDTVPVFSFLTVRYFIAFFTLMLLFGKRVITNVKKTSPAVWLPPSLCIALCYVINNLALSVSAATSTAFLRSLSTVITPVLSCLVYKTDYNKKHIPIQIMVIVGLYLLCGVGGLSGFGFGEILTLISAVLMAGALVFGGRSLSKIDPLTLTTLQAGVSAVSALICALLFDHGIRLQSGTPQVFMIILYMAILCTLTGYLLQNTALSLVSDRSVALFQCFCPIMTGFFSYIILGEQMNAFGYLGSAVILACVVLETRLSGKESNAPQ